MKPRVILLVACLFTASVGRSQTSAWYYYSYWLSARLGTTLPNYYDYLFPDSTVQMLWSIDNKLHYCEAHSWGQVLDPTSIVFPDQLTNTTGYAVDSIHLVYRYWRYQNGNPDTLVMQLFNHDKILFNQWHGVKDTPFATVRYDSTTRRGSYPTREYKYLLTTKDTSTAQGALLRFSISPPMQVPAGGKVAATFTYYPGNTYRVGDTIYPYTSPPPSNQINGFRIAYTRDASRFFEDGKYNNGLAVWNGERYHSDPNGWNKLYHAECARWDGNQNLLMAFRLNYGNTSSPPLSSDHLRLIVYPNPVKAGSQLNVSMDLPASELSVTLHDLAGKAVLQLPVTKHKGGLASIIIPGESLRAGPYLLIVKSGDGTQVRKMVVVEP